LLSTHNQKELYASQEKSSQKASQEKRLLLQVSSSQKSPLTANRERAFFIL